MGRWRRYYTKQSAWRRQKRRRSSKGVLYGGSKAKVFSKEKSLGIDEAVGEGNTFAYSDDDMRKVCEGEVEIMSYRQVMECESLDEVLGDNGACIFLYETKPQYGHWCALIGMGNGMVEFFDPYGQPPDSQLKYVPKSMGCEPVLQDLCDAANATLVWNKHRLQSEASNKSTCGRWCSVRVAMRYMTSEQFAKFFLNQKLPPDSYVTLLTLFVR